MIMEKFNAFVFKIAYNENDINMFLSGGFTIQTNLHVHVTGIGRFFSFPPLKRNYSLCPKYKAYLERLI